MFLKYRSLIQEDSSQMQESCYLTEFFSDVQHIENHFLTSFRKQTGITTIPWSILQACSESQLLSSQNECVNKCIKDNTFFFFFLRAPLNENLVQNMCVMSVACVYTTVLLCLRQNEIACQNWSIEKPKTFVICLYFKLRKRKTQSLMVGPYVEMAIKHLVFRMQTYFPCEVDLCRKLAFSYYVT